MEPRSLLCSDSNESIVIKQDVNKIINKLKSFFDGAKIKDKVAIHSSVIETDFEHEKFEDKVESHIPGLNSYGTFDDTVELKLCQNFAARIEQTLKYPHVHCELIVPCDLTSKISQDAIRMSHSEPCGLRGCILIINLEEKDICTRIGRLVYDPKTVATFELHLTLKEDTRNWVLFKKLFFKVHGCLMNTNAYVPKVVCSGFQLVKKKLYRSN